MMTEKEAISQLYGLKNNLFSMNYAPTDKEIKESAIETAISALEKQIPKKPILYMNEKSGMFVDYADGHGEYKTQTNNWWRCPTCGEVVGQRVVVYKRIHDQRKKNFCEKCGQAIDWS